jgi:Pentapeptide repeats (8 copies)
MRLVFHVAIFLILPGCLFSSMAYGQPPCDGPWNGKTPSTQELQKLLAAHKVWVEEFRKARAADKTIAEVDGMRRANLCGAQLFGMNLDHIYFPFADLRGVQVLDSSLENADLRAADLTGISMFSGNLLAAGPRLPPHRQP